MPGGLFFRISLDASGQTRSTTGIFPSSGIRRRVYLSLRRLSFERNGGANITPATALTVVFLLFLVIGLVGLFIVLTDKGLRWKK